MEPSDFLPFLDEETRRRVVERVCENDERLFRRGDEPRSMFYVLDGEARLIRHSPAGIEVVFQRARRGFLAEASLEQPAYHCDGVAAGNTRFLCVPIDGFRRALSHEKLVGLWMRHLGRELRRARAQSERLVLRSARDRIVHFIETEGRSGTLVLSQTKKSWASEMGLTHEALYRTLRAMEQAGVLHVSGQRIELGKALRPDGRPFADEIGNASFGRFPIGAGKG
ncbi:MAG: Crp/Fnr family transcriptional regulator [Hyphomicrobiales bacterium]|nr:Crp/Fnr family transcriptional regulator [Hyphomicrobiales bacterium]